MGYVYLIYDINNNVYKIGVTRKKDSKRINSLQTGNSTQLKIINMIECEFPFRLETMLHNFYKEKQVLNEWYDLTKSDVAEFINTCNKFISIINSLKDNPFFTKGLK